MAERKMFQYRKAKEAIQEAAISISEAKQEHKIEGSSETSAVQKERAHELEGQHLNTAANSLEKVEKELEKVAEESTPAAVEEKPETFDVVIITNDGSVIHTKPFKQNYKSLQEFYTEVPHGVPVTDLDDYMKLNGPLKEYYGVTGWKGQNETQKFYYVVPEKKVEETTKNMKKVRRYVLTYSLNNEPQKVKYFTTLKAAVKFQDKHADKLTYMNLPQQKQDVEIDPKPSGKGKTFEFFGRFKDDAAGKVKAEAKEKEHPGSFIQSYTDKKDRKYLRVVKSLKK